MFRTHALLLAASALTACTALSGSPDTDTDASSATPQPIRISAWKVPPAYVGLAYRLDASCGGGRDPVSWSLAGTVPGLHLGINTRRAFLTGTPTAIGTYDVLLSVTDADHVTDTKPLRIVVDRLPPPPSVETLSLASALTGSAYSATIVASGGLAPVTWSVTGLPPGLSFNATTHVISGTPSSAGSYAVEVHLLDNAARTADQTLALEVVDPLSIATLSVPDAHRFTAYSAALSASGGRAPYSWSITAGGLPAGLTLNGAAIQGTPSAIGDYSFTVELHDALGLVATRAFLLHVTEMVGPPADPQYALWPVPPPFRAVSEFQVFSSSVTDTLTHLSWEKTPFLAATSAEAATHCASLALGGRSDWRVPAFVELVSILSSEDTYRLASVFVAPTTGQLWASAGGVMEFGGDDYSTLSVYCVRADPVADHPRYTSVATSISTNNFTGRMWLTDRGGGIPTSQIGAQLCEGLTAAGFSDWRTPTFKELLSEHGTGTLGLFGWYATAGGERFVPSALAQEPSDASGVATAQSCVRNVQSSCGTIVADASHTPASVPSGQIFQLDAGASTSAGSCTPSYTWTVSGGGVMFMQLDSAGLTSPVLPIAPGTYTVTLRATVDGAQSVSTRMLTITAPASCSTLWLDVFEGPPLSAVASGGTPPYAYVFNRPLQALERQGQWINTGITSVDNYDYYFTPDSVQSWRVLVIDALGCVVEIDAETGCT